MRNVLFLMSLPLIAVLIIGAATPTPPVTSLPGSDRDAHGCIGSAGYTWCDAKHRCIRAWEEPCQ